MGPGLLPDRARKAAALAALLLSTAAAALKRAPSRESGAAGAALARARLCAPRSETRRRSSWAIRFLASSGDCTSTKTRLKSRCMRASRSEQSILRRASQSRVLSSLTKTKATVVLYSGGPMARTSDGSMGMARPLTIPVLRLRMVYVCPSTLRRPPTGRNVSKMVLMALGFSKSRASPALRILRRSCCQVVGSRRAAAGVSPGAACFSVAAVRLTPGS